MQTQENISDSYLTRKNWEMGVRYVMSYFSGVLDQVSSSTIRKNWELKIGVTERLLLEAFDRDSSLVSDDSILNTLQDTFSRSTNPQIIMKVLNAIQENMPVLVADASLLRCLRQFVDRPRTTE